MRKKNLLIVICLVWVVLTNGWLAQKALADEPVVRAVIFYSPSCGHCHKVLTEDIPPLIEQYEDQLQIIVINVSVEGGQEIFLSALQKFGMESGGVPMLVIGDQALVGSLDIPEQFPKLIQEYLAKGGVDWPDIPGLAEAIGAAMVTPTAASSKPSPTDTPEDQGVASATPEAMPTDTVVAGSAQSSSNLVVIGTQPGSVIERLTQDPTGNTMAILVLFGMIAVVGRFVVVLPGITHAHVPAWRDWAIPILALLGCGVAIYMAYVETAQVTAVCGPVGDCNTVQQSAYARLFGILPIGVLGVLGYIAILAAWLVHRFSRGRPADLAALALFIMTTLGTLFSIYLTFLEPFVIGATCAWCLSSAIIMTFLFWLTIPFGRQAITNLNQGDAHA